MIEITDNRKELLQNLMDTLMVSILVSKKKYYHPKTTYNLIFHFDKIKSEVDRIWVFNNLDAYLKRCMELIPEMNLKTSEVLFDEYIYKLIRYYHKNIGFWLFRITPGQTLIYLIVLAVSFYFFQIWVSVMIATFFLILIAYSIFKFREKKVYGIFF
jgi:hypothetical protein